MAKRSELFEPGAYMGLPFAVAKRPDISPTAKLVWAVLAHRLGPSNTEAWPSLKSIALMVGCGRRTVQTAVEQLQEADLLEATPPRPGETMSLPDGRVVPATSRYVVKQTEATLFDETDDAKPAKKTPATSEGYSKSGASAETALAPDLHQPSAESAHKVLKGSTEATTPPTPPTSGGVGEDATQDNHDGQGNDQYGATAGRDPVDILADVCAAYREVFGQEMPNTWLRPVRQCLRHSKGGYAGLVTADVLRLAEAWRQRRGLKVFGWGTVLRYLENRERKRREADQHRRKQAEAAERARRMADSAARAAEESARQEREPLDAFATLTEAEQDKWRARVREGPTGWLLRGHPDRITAAAAALAWAGRSPEPSQPSA